MTQRTFAIDGVEVPAFFYGTAWKEEQTQHLTELAIACGFRGIDTANQRRHYDEAAVGRAIAAAISKGSLLEKGTGTTTDSSLMRGHVQPVVEPVPYFSSHKGVVAREDLFLQTKFTFRRGQDHRLPYDPEAAIPVQVEQSFASSLAHLGVERIDSYLLHGPTSSTGLAADDWAAWRAMETIHDSGRAKMLGVSNFQIEQLQQLWQKARVHPRFVQNRCYASLGWDREVREFCRAHDVVYQGFSLLTANRETLAAAQTAQIAARHRRTIPQIIFRFAIQIGIIPLTGTSDAEHMQADLEVFDFRLEPAEMAWLEGGGTG